MGREEACTQRYRKSRGPATAETTPKSPLRLPEAGVGYRMRPRSRGGGRDRDHFLKADLPSKNRSYRAGPSACSAAGQPRQGEEEVSSRRGARGATRAEPAAKRSGDLRRVLGRRGPHATCTAFAGAGHCASGPAVVPGLSHRGCLPAVPI
ncbi:unnamed protein product [Prorocentrum cordatum]|uniref:Uncharacterized protein n=1 Tax=Prorocentrum cordatum TaxID=2364126 RepID=A0ABN9SBL6_9DINO|nr:unnamed protein product [Polarella glacialis]